MESCSARSDIGMYTPYNVFKLPWSNAFQTLAILTPFCQAARMPNPKATLSCFHQQLKSFLTLPNTHTCLPSTTSSCPGASTRAEHLWLQRASLSLSLFALSQQGGQAHEKWAEQESSVKARIAVLCLYPLL